MKQTAEPPPSLASRLLASAAGLDPSEVKVGDLLTCRVDLALSHEALARAVEPFRQMGATRVWDPERVVVALDHWVPPPTDRAKQLQRTVYRFVQQQGIAHFYNAGQGICHQLLVEQGHVRPGQLVVGTDSHTTTAGALGAFACGIGPTEFAAVLATGELWLKVPPTVGVRCRGDLPKGVHAKDLALAAMGKVSCRGAAYKAVEWQGPTVEDLTLGDRQVLCNMAAEMGAKASLVAADEDFLTYLHQFQDHPRLQQVLAEERAQQPSPLKALECRHDIDASRLRPQVACPASPDNVCDVGQVEGTPVDQVFIGSCTNGRLEDLEVAAGLLKGRRVAADTRVVIHPASKTVMEGASIEGYIKQLKAAGAIIGPPGCGPCFGGHGALLDEGETCLSTANRNFPGRMGHVGADIYLGSPATAAATAIEGKIADPRRYL